jgi:hypothetical protein
MRGIVGKLDLTEADFQAFSASVARGTSVKRRMLGWAEGVRAALSGLGIEVEISAEAKQSVVFQHDGNGQIELCIQADAVTLMLAMEGDVVPILARPSADVLAAWEDAAGLLIDARETLSSRARPLTTVEDAQGVASRAHETGVPLVIGVRLARAEAIKPHALDSFHDVGVSLGRLLHVLGASPESPVKDRPSSHGGRGRPALARGAHVRALAGPFAGPTGVVQELDGKGAARVLFGLLGARVPLEDLTIHDTKRGRPVLSSSHRKPSS